MGVLSHSAVVFDGQPEMKNVRAKAIRSISAKLQSVFARDVRDAVSSMVLVKRERPW